MGTMVPVTLPHAFFGYGLLGHGHAVAHYMLYSVLVL